jgi:hypothetical protein
MEPAAPRFPFQTKIERLFDCILVTTRVGHKAAFRDVRLPPRVKDLPLKPSRDGRFVPFPVDLATLRGTPCAQQDGIDCELTGDWVTEGVDK